MFTRNRKVEVFVSTSFIFSMVFSFVLPVEVFANEGDTDAKLCPKETIVVSDTSNEITDGVNAVAAYASNTDWTASIPGATWIWKSFYVENPEQDETYTFSKTFNIETGSVIDSASLIVAADNTYTVSINGTEVGSDSNPYNFRSGDEDTYDASSFLVEGENVINFSVTNQGFKDATPEINPAGLLYKLTINTHNKCEDNDGGNPPPVYEHTCALPDSLGDETVDAIILGWDSVSLQDIFNAKGIDKNVITDQKQYQSWNTPSATTTIDIEFISRNAALNSVFGYYKNGDISSFIPVFRSGSVDGFTSTTEFSTGQLVSFDITSADNIGFTIKTSDGNTYATLNSLNENSNDHVVIYELGSNVYIISFEDLALASSDMDYNDIIVKITMSGCQDTPVPTPININIVASKIMCDSESDLPNWGEGGPDITASSTTEFLNSHPNCHLERDWYFQWADNTTSDPGGSFVGEAGGNWSTFGPTDQWGNATTSARVFSNTPYVWVREVLKENYITFSYPGNNSSTSPEMYCHIDVLNYDNYDRIDGPLTSESTYYCVAFNVKATSTPPAINTPPTITLVGDNPLNLTAGDTFTDPGATADDAEDGNLTPAIISTSTVDSAIVGSYTVTYFVYDSGGLGATTTRDVIVSPASIPPVIPPGGGGGGGGHRHPVVIGEILGATSCLYLIDYLKIDWQNDKIEVLKLQSFLNVFEGENLSLTGVFDETTFRAVERFQIKYSGDILEPWGENVTTGFVYILTKKKVNEIYCNTIYPLSQTDQNEINAFKNSSGGASGNTGFLQDSNTGSGVLGDVSVDNSLVVDLENDSQNDNSKSESVVRNVAISLFALPQKMFGDIFGNCTYTPILLLLILIAIVIAISRSFMGPKNSGDITTDAPIIPVSKIEENEIKENEESPVIILPGTLPDEEIVIENPEEDIGEETIDTPDLRS